MNQKNQQKNRSILFLILMFSIFLSFPAMRNNTKTAPVKNTTEATTASTQTQSHKKQLAKSANKETTTTPSVQTTTVTKDTAKKNKKKSTTRKAKNSYVHAGKTMSQIEKEYQNKINFQASYPYRIKVNRIANCVTVYGIDFEGNYSIPYLSFICSVGKPYTITPAGTFSVSDKYDWRLMVDNTYAQYAVRISGQIMFHSVGYYSADKSDLEYEEYNKLGSEASLGCIRLSAIDAKWIYDNCPVGTVVEVYDDSKTPGPLGRPTAKKINLSSPYRGWDPTDPDVNNPWNTQERNQ